MKTYLPVWLLEKQRSHIISGELWHIYNNDNNKQSATPQQ
jgi:hypothetical protein